MRKLTFLFALLCVSMFLLAQEKDVNYALATNGSSAMASSGNASLAIDGNDGTRWESAYTDDEWLVVNMGQVRTFNTVRINWEGAFAKEFTIYYSTDSINWSTFYVETNLVSAGWQTIYKELTVSAQYVRYHGTKRATGYGQSFWEFQVLNGDAPRENIALGKTIIASSVGYNDVNRVVDGNFGTEWQGSLTNGTTDDEVDRTFDAWFVVDLGKNYDVDQVNMTFEGACSQEYHIDFAADTLQWALGYDYVGAAGINGHTDVIKTLTNNQNVRYVRFWSTKAATQWGVKVFEIEVFGTESTTTGVDVLRANEKAQKVMINGQVLIIRNGVKYDTTGTLVK